MLSAKTFFQLTGVIFSVIGVLHLLRLFYGWSIVIVGWTVPLWFSAVGIVIAWYIAYNAWQLAKKKK